jgi:cobalt-zinc-cadmium efflux system membrane fusion protein
MNPNLLPRLGRRWMARLGGTALVLCALTAVAAEKHGHDHDHDHDTPKTAAKPATGGNVDDGHRHPPAAGGTTEPEKDNHAHGEDAHDDEVKLAAEAVTKYAIRVEPVTRRSLTATFVAPARVSFNANAMAHVGSAVKGRVAELKVQVGDEVKRDDVLLVVESPELGEAQSDFVQKRGAATAAAPVVESAKSGYERAKELYDQTKGISLTDLQKRETDYKAAQAALQMAQTAATAAANKLHLLGMDRTAVGQLAKTGEIKPRYALRAPLAGQVTEREVTFGELVGPEREHLLIIADMATLWVLADVPEARLKGLKKGAEARIALAALPDERVIGTVSFVAQTVDPATRTVKVRIEVQNGHGELRPGMFAKAEIASGGEDKGESVLAVPDEAVQTVEGGPAVFVPVEGEENTFAKRSITVGKPVGGWVPVLSGLKEGARVVVSGTFILKAELGKSGAAHEH